MDTNCFMGIKKYVCILFVFIYMQHVFITYKMIVALFLYCL